MKTIIFVTIFLLLLFLQRFSSPSYISLLKGMHQINIFLSILNLLILVFHLLLLLFLLMVIVLILPSLSVTIPSYLPNFRFCSISYFFHPSASPPSPLLLLFLLLLLPLLIPIFISIPLFPLL